ncbi:head GIN domain-containing protein [Alkalitalea saponilacus]|uniref:Putative auto-transporter adhesin, head GIN domain n=1 Tax=Alkalitalea saponilacus TaxID=889453 RepID=A0A1T5HSC5_9BACT|nr:head GIN domain-containing protein [Alkalitalea saponilacus]ASB48359.1 hypothetical protein CDL62_03985 [Alkalitalea saponilacus]SKC23589.1 Putative auto-transporter adhesin, head GIN domain [Alkalitalea saponilacus]
MKRVYNYIILVLTVSLFSSCVMDSGSSRFSHHSFDNSDKVEVRRTGDFTTVDLVGDFEIFLQKGDENRLELKGDKNMLDRVLINHDDDRLVVELLTDNISRRSASRVGIRLTVTELKSLTAVSRISLHTPSEFTFDSLVMNFAGAVNVNLDLSGKYLELNFAGATSADIEGNVECLKVNMPGAGKLNAYDLMAEKVDLVLAGAGSANVFASEELKVEVAGACVVNYRGNPRNLYSNVSGIGRVRAVD